MWELADVWPIYIKRECLRKLTLKGKRSFIYWNNQHVKESLLSCISIQFKCFIISTNLIVSIFFCFSCGYRSCWLFLCCFLVDADVFKQYEDSGWIWGTKAIMTTDGWRVRALRAPGVSCSRSQFTHSHVNEPSYIPSTCPLGAALRSPVSLQALLAAGIARPSVPLTSCNGSLDYTPTSSPVGFWSRLG